MNIKALSIPKTSAGELQIDFGMSFSATPVVIVSPYWKSGPSAVGSVETVSAISTTGCTIISPNCDPANNYNVNVLVLDAGRNTIGSTAIVAGSAVKTTDLLKINFPGERLNFNDPATLLTSFWQGSGSAVGFYDTLDDSAASECSVRSRNMANNYYTQYVGVDLGITHLDDTNVLVAGIANKTAAGTLRVYFNTIFSTPPTVFVSPWWDDANAPVGSIETVINVTNDYFDLISANAGPNYFVNWIAVGAIK